jgi:hypothetical protein
MLSNLLNAKSRLSRTALQDFELERFIRRLSFSVVIVTEASG